MTTFGGTATTAPGQRAAGRPWVSPASLAPLAVLARAPEGPPQRVDLLRKALTVIRDETTGHDRDDLVGAAATYAAVHLDLPTILEAGREAGMPISLEGTQVARAIAEAAEARGREQGLEQGLGEGLEQGLARGREERRAFLDRLLRDKYGDDERIDRAIEQVSGLSSSTVLTAHRVTATLDDFLGMLPLPV